MSFHVKSKLHNLKVFIMHKDLVQCNILVSLLQMIFLLLNLALQLLYVFRNQSLVIGYHKWVLEEKFNHEVITIQCHSHSYTAWFSLAIL